MIPQELVHGLYLTGLEFTLKLSPVRLQHFKRREREDLLHEGEHPGAKQEHAFPPILKLRMPILLGRMRCLTTGVGATATRSRRTTPRHSLVLDPHGRQRLLNMVEMEQKPEYELIPKDRLA